MDTLREQADSCRKLALRARTQSGCDAPSAVARQFEDDAMGHFREPTTIRLPDGDAAALVRLRLALERQTADWLQRRPMPYMGVDS